MTAATEAGAVGRETTAPERWTSTALWAVAASAVALLLVAPMWLSPVASVSLLLAGVLVAVALVAPQLLLAIVLAVIIFSIPLQAVLGGVAASLDDAAVLFAVVALTLRRFATTGRVVWLPGTGWFAGFVALGLLSSLAQQVPVSTALQGAFVIMKALLLAFAAAQVPWTRRHLQVAVRAGVVLVVMVVVTGVVNLAAPAAWAALLGTPAERGPLGLPALTGIFGRPGAYSRFCGVLALAALAYALVVRRTPVAWAAFASCTALAFLTLQVKSLLGLLATTALVSLPWLVRARGLVVLAFLPLVAAVLAPPLVLLVTTDVNQYVFQVSARSLLTEGGLSVAAATFPLGAGFGRYGGSVAADTYSPWYYRLGFQDRFGLGPAEGSGQFLNDTQWPSLIAEPGWLGAACFAAGVACVLVALLRSVHKERDRLLRWVQLSAVSWMLLLLIESAAAPVFVSAPAYPFVFLGAAVSASYLHSRRYPAPEPAAAGPEAPASADPVPIAS